LEKLLFVIEPELDFEGLRSVIIITSLKAGENATEVAVLKWLEDDAGDSVYQT
jgi:hypothetical protein